jgi:hypothetical protein
MAAVWEKTKRLDDEAKAEFTVVAKVVHSAENRLRRSLKDVQSASADEWPQARSALAADYESYQQAIAQAERLELANAVPGSPRRERHPH